VKDVTSTSFGLFIAFLLPGLVGLFAVSFWFPIMRSLFTTFLTAESNVGLFFLVILASVVIGLEVTVIRWVLFEELLCRPSRLRPEDFANLDSESKLTAFRACVDEHYRYHQFWGGMTIVIPILYAGWLHHLLGGLTGSTTFFSMVMLIGLEFLTVIGAIRAYRYYVTRARRILTGG
jgi:hypothetical protein